MSDIGNVLTSFKTALATAAPTRVVTRAMKDFGDRTKAELTQGVLTIIYRGQPDIRPLEESLSFMVVGQIELADKATGEQVEEAELLMMEDVRKCVDRLEGATARIRSYQHSQQIEKPFGWVAAIVELGAFDLTCSPDPTKVNDFVKYRADHTVADGTAPIPVAQDSVDLPQT